MTKLSPATQVVLTAYNQRELATKRTTALVAALRAVANEVVPLSYEDVWTDGRMLQYEKHDPIRERLLAIANELENQ
jgi:hypothetical protein